MECRGTVYRTIQVEKFEFLGYIRKVVQWNLVKKNTLKTNFYTVA